MTMSIILGFYLGLALLVNVRCSTVSSLTVTEPPLCEVGDDSLTLNESARKETSLTFIWNLSDQSISRCTNITICITPEDASCSLPNITETSGAAVFTSLTPGREYTAEIRAYDSNNYTSDQEIARTVPAPPENVSALVIWTNGITLQIVKPDPGEVSQYLITYLTVDGFPENANITGTNDTFITHNITSLTPGHQYEFVVYSYSGNIISTRNTSSQPVTTDLVPPESPQIISVHETAIAVNWTEPNATYDVVIITCTGSQNALNSTATVPYPKNYGICTGLTPGAVYEVVLKTALNDSSTPPVGSTEDLSCVTIPFPPDNVAANTESSESITLLIECPNDTKVDTYSIKYSSESLNATYEEHITTVTLGDLAGGTVYNISVYSCSYGVCSTRSTSASNTTYTNSPVNVTVTCVNETSITVRWDEPSGNVDEYIVMCNDTGVTIISDTVATCTDLVSGSPYEVTVCSSLDNHDRRDNCSETVTNVTVPYGPESVVVDDRNSTAIVLNVTGPALETEFDVYLVYVNGDERVEAPGWETCLITVGNLTAGTTYDLEVYTSSYDVLSDEVAVISETTLLTTPTDISITVKEQNITSTWVKPVGNSDFVTMYCEGSDGALSTTVTVASDTETATCSGLTAGAIYHVTLGSSLNDTDLAPPVNSSTVLSDVTEPLPPSGVTVESVNITAINVTIDYKYNNTMGQCSEFRITYQGNGEDNGKMEYNLSCQFKNTLLTGLEENSLYVVNVSTLSKTGSGVELPKESKSVSNTTHGWTLPGQVSYLNHTLKGSRWFFATWSEVKNEKNTGLYVLYVEHLDTCLQKIPLEVSGEVKIIPAECNHTCNVTKDLDTFNASGYNVTDLMPYYNYKFYVVAVNPGGCGNLSEPEVVTTSEEIPGVVQGLASTPSNYSMNVTWKAPDHPNGIIINYTIKWCQLDQFMEIYCYNDTTEDQRVYNIDDLQAYTNYSISVAAHTSIGQGEFEEIQSTTLTGIPFQPVNVTTPEIGLHNITVQWLLDEDAYPTGAVIFYEVSAAPTPPYDVEKKNVTLKGFDTNKGTVEGLEPYTLYDMCVRAYTTDEYNRTLFSDISNPCAQAETYQGAPREVEEIIVYNDDICYEMNLTWFPPSIPNGVLTEYNVSLVNTVNMTDRHEYTFPHTGTQSQKQTHNVTVDPNDQEYNITVIAKTVAYGIPNSQLAKSGKCTPTSLDSSEFFSNPGVKSKTTFKVSMDQCSLCFNPNGNITFLGLIITENMEDMTEITFSNQTELNKVFKPYANHNATVGYRTTPDDWIKEINCTINCQDSSRRYRQEIEEHLYSYTVGAGGNCANYCNHALEDSKDVRKFKVRLAMETPGGILVTESSDDVYELKPNNAWIAAPVIIVLLVVVAFIVVFIVMRKKHLGPFNDNTRETRTVQDVNGTTNPAFMDIDIQRPSPVSVLGFEAYVAERASDSDLLFSEEYKLIQEMSPKHPHKQAELPNNRLKNRFVNILPFDHSRVKLLSADDDESSDYINANYMPGFNSKREFIASQGPMSSTVDDFWRMIWEQNVPLIVMLTQLEERGRERCAKYWPSDNEPVFYGELCVRLVSESVLDSFVIRILDIQLGETKRVISQYHYMKWPDFGVPQDPTDLVDFVRTVRSKISQNVPGPVLVHCSAGVGRTGSFIAIDHLLQRIKVHNTIDIFGLILEMRNYRCYMIQVEAQYTLIHKCILAAIKRGLHKEVTCINTYDDCTDESIYENV